MILDNFPLFLQVCARPLYNRLKYNHVFNNQLNFLMESQWWTKEQIEEYQTIQLQKLIKHAYKNVPYYTKSFDEKGIKPRDVQSIGDINRIPYITKKDIQRNYQQLKARNYPPWKFVATSTGGSTGTPLKVMYERGVTYQKEIAFQWRQFKELGIKGSDKVAILRGYEIKKQKDLSKPVFSKELKYQKCIMLSSHLLESELLIEYIETIQKYKPSYIRAFPSILYILSKFMYENGMQISNIGSLITSSETLHPLHRSLIKKAFKNSKILDYYGNSEASAFISQCANEDLYHVMPEHGIVEIIDINENQVNEEREKGEIISTCFNNYAFPLIRYRTNDFAIWTNEMCSCKKNHQYLKAIDGKIQEFIVTRKRDLIPISALNVHEDLFRNVIKFQYYQDKIGKVTLNIVKKESFSEKDSSKIYSVLQKKLGIHVDLNFEFVNEIPRTKRGKYSWLIQKLDTKFGD